MVTSHVNIAGIRLCTLYKWFIYRVVQKPGQCPLLVKMVPNISQGNVTTYLVCWDFWRWLYYNHNVESERIVKTAQNLAKLRGNIDAPFWTRNASFCANVYMQHNKVMVMAMHQAWVKPYLLWIHKPATKHYEQNFMKGKSTNISQNFWRGCASKTERFVVLWRDRSSCRYSLQVCFR